MFKMKRFLHLMLAVVMLLSCIQVPSAYAADTPTTVTVNVTNTPVRGDIVLEKSGMQLVRFADEKDVLLEIVSLTFSQLYSLLCFLFCLFDFLPEL